MAKRDEAAAKLLQWELDGHGGLVMQAMLEHPDMSLVEAVELIEQENPTLAARGNGPDASPPTPLRPRATTELDALNQEFQTFRHLLSPHEAETIELELREIAKTHDRSAMGHVRRRLRALSLQASFYSELAATGTESNAIGLVILRRGGRTLAKAGETSYLDQSEVAVSVVRETARREKGTFVMHLPVGRLVLNNGEGTSIAALFRRAPGKDVVSVLTKTVEAIEENKAAASRTFGDPKLASRYADALLKLLQKTSL